MSGEPLFEAKVLPALEKALRAAKKHGFPFVATLQITSWEGEEPATFASFWHLPPAGSDTLRDGLTALCPEWEAACQKDEEQP